MKIAERSIIDSFAAGSFAISALLTALRTSTERQDLRTPYALIGDPLAPSAGLSLHAGGPANMLGVVSQPTNLVLWSLLIAVVLAAGLYAGLRLRHPVAPLRQGTLSGGLLLGAVWPWLVNPMPLVGLALAAASCVLLAAGIVARWRGGRSKSAGLAAGRGTADQNGEASRFDVGALPIAFMAGWMLMAGTSAMGMYVHHRLGLGLERSVLLGLLPAALIGAWYQLRLDGAVTFALALIWAMIGFAAATAGASITIATACVLCLSAMAVVVVRVTT